MRVEMLNAGWVNSPSGIWRRDDPFDEETRFPVPAWLIETEDERILVDTGLNPAAIADPVEHYASETLGFFRLELDEPIGEQIDLDTITKVVLTHLHFDHAGGLAQIPSSVPIVLQRSEWEGGRDTAAIERNYFHPSDYEAVGDQVTLVDGDHDLLGDGSVELLLTPGHTPGHQSVRVGDGLILGADVAHFASSLDDHRFPAFADDFKAQATSADRLREMRDAGATVTPGHDPAVLRPGPVG